MKVTGILTRERSEEEKLRRHLYGDRGAKFSGGKIPKVDMGGVIGTVTTMITKDILLIEYEDNTDRKYSSNAEGLCEPAGRESVSSEWTWDDNKKRQSVLGATDGVSRTLLATYYKIGTYNVFEHGFMAVIEYEDIRIEQEPR